jgi:UDP-glucose 4-epimerase
MRNPVALVTGGAGFVGSHCCRDLLDHGFDVVVVDCLINSSATVIKQIRKLGSGRLVFHQTDINDKPSLQKIFQEHKVDVVIHFAAHKAVGDSIDRPLDYYTNNVSGLLSLLEVMHASGVKHLIFSSSCSIYGHAVEHPIAEASPARPTNPYARSKWMCELILQDLCSRYEDWSVTALRYFNPAGAHESGELGEDPRGIPRNIVPFLAQLAAGRRGELQIFGSNYETKDGTAIRDYIHVLDVVEGHRRALEVASVPGFRRYNLGTGVGTTVLELLAEFERACGQQLPHKFVDRRPGDVPELVAAPDSAMSALGWQARRSLADICRDAWRFQTKYPFGYGENADGVSA